MGNVDDFLAGLDAPRREAFEHVRDLVLEVAPGAEQGTSYGMAAFRMNGKPLLGMASARSHLSIFPFSPEVVERVRGRLGGFSLSKGTIRFQADAPVPDDLVREVVRARLAEIQR